MDRVERINKSEWLTSYNNFEELFHNETDRAAAVLAASYLENIVGMSIKSFLVDDPSVEELFEGYGPLSSFSARISVAYALGLITKDMRNDLNYIRKIRNHFAHHPSEVSFTLSPVRNFCSNFSTNKLDRFDMAETFHKAPPRLQFIFAVGVIVSLVNLSMPKQKRRVPPTANILSDKLKSESVLGG